MSFKIVPRFDVQHSEVTPGGLNAPMPGLILDVRVKAGQHVNAGETLVVMEAMKMEHVISAPSTGTVSEVLVTASQQVDNSAPLLNFDPDHTTNKD